LKGWWSKFARPDTAVLIFSGDIEAKEAFELARKTFGNWKTPGERPDIKISKPAEPAETHIYLVDRPGSTQSQIRAGQRGITRHDDGYFVSRIVSNYFGWAYNSRLNESIRVAKGLTYGVWGGYTANRFAGEFEVGTFSKTESTAEAVRAVLEEIERLKAQGPSVDELESSRSYILGSFVRGRETPQQIAGDLWLIESQGLGADYLERLLGGIAKAKRTDCERLVGETIEPSKLVIIVVGEAEKLKGELEKIAPVTVVEAEEKK
jgi:zinc protease